MNRARLAVGFSLVLMASLGGCKDRAVLKAEDDGLHAVKVGDFSKAEADFTYALDKTPGRVPSRLGMAKALMGQGRAAEARPHLEVAYSIDPTNEEVIDLLAEAMLQDGKTDEMARLLHGRAIELQTSKEWVRYGRFAARSNDADGAENAFITAARLDKGQSVEAQLGLADLYTQIGDDERALRRLRMALYLRPQDVVVQSRIRAMGGVPTESFAIVPTEALAAE